MPEVENDYVATATAEKRLREVLAHQFHDAGFLDDLSAVLLAGAEITYLPRKKSVSIVLRVPATAGSKPTADNSEAASVMPIRSGENVEQYNPNGSDVPDDTPVLGATTVGDVQAAARGARFGLFTPTSTDESDYFTE